MLCSPRGAAQWRSTTSARRSTLLTRPLPGDFLTAVAAVGDGSCLEPMARAWAATPGEEWWRGRLAEAAVDILRREKLTGRSAAVKRVRAKWPGFI